MNCSSSSRCPEQRSNSTCTCKSSLRLSSNEHIQRAIDILQHSRLSLLTALIKVLDPSKEDFATHRERFYACTKDQPTGKLAKLLDRINEDPRGCTQLFTWMDPRTIARVTRKESDEMDDIKDILRVKITDITPNFLANWDITSTIGEAILERAPVLTQVLRSAAQTERASRENTTKDCTTPCQVLMTQLAKARSNCSLYFAAPSTIFNGRMALCETLARCGLCISFTSLSTLLNQLASRCVNNLKAIQVAQRPHILCYDNINISISTFVEQRLSAPAKVYQARINVIGILLQGSPAFKDYEHRLSPPLRHEDRRRLARNSANWPYAGRNASSP